MPAEKQRARRVYAPEFKAMVVREARSGDWSQGEVARRHGIHFTLVSQWLRGRPSEAKVRPPAEKPARRGLHRRTASLALTVAATQRALGKVNGDAPGGALAGSPGAGALIKEVLLRLRGIGIHIESVNVKDDSCEVSYSVKETFDL